MNGFKSIEFGENPLLSNSKLWKQSPIQNEDIVRVGRDINKKHSDYSDDSYISNNASVPDEEYLSLSPMPKINNL